MNSTFSLTKLVNEVYSLSLILQMHFRAPHRFVCHPYASKLATDSILPVCVLRTLAKSISNFQGLSILFNYQCSGLFSLFLLTLSAFTATFIYYHTQFFLSTTFLFLLCFYFVLFFPFLNL